MQKLTSYILKDLFVSFLIITVSLLCLVWLIQSMRFIEQILNEGIPVSIFFELSALVIPTILSLILPFTYFVSILYVYNRLSSDSELVVMHASGVSYANAAKPALYFSIILMLFSYLLTLYIVPASYRNFKNLQDLIRNEYSSALLQEGVFNNVAKGITIYVESRLSASQLRGILAHDQRDPTKAPSTFLAETGTVNQTEKGPRLMMTRGSRQQLSKSGNLALLEFDHYTLDIMAIDEASNYRWLEPRERFLHELFSPNMEEHDNIKNLQVFRAEGHQRITQPIYVLTFGVIALTLLLTGSFSRLGQTRKIILAVLAILLIQATSLTIKNYAAKYSWAEFLIYLNAIIPLLIFAYYLIGEHRLKKTQRKKI